MKRDAAVLAEADRRAAERWQRAASTPRRVNAAIRAWAAHDGRTVASTGRIPTRLREAWLEATGGVVTDPRGDRRNVGRTEAAQAYRLLHTGMAQAVSDGLIPANPCAIRGASQRDSRHRTERRVLTPDDLWAGADAMPERCASISLWRDRAPAAAGSRQPSPARACAPSSSPPWQ